MNNDSVFGRIITAGVIGLLCFAASLLVLGLVSERQETFNKAQQDVAKIWGKNQLIAGPVLTFTGVSTDKANLPPVYHLLPKTVNYETDVTPEIRSKGIFNTVVYTSKLKVTGTFAAEDAAGIDVPYTRKQNPVFSLGISDTRGIEKQVMMTWDGQPVALDPSAGNDPVLQSSGLHASVLLGAKKEIPFSLEVAIKGSESLQFLPMGGETTATLRSSWPTPEFIGNYLPSERNISDQGFNAVWRVSSFGRNYPQVLSRDFNKEEVSASQFGVDLHQGVDFYTKLFRIVKYAILFIAITFIAFLLFEILLGLRIHPVQYLLVGIALALFYLLLLSFSEQIGFGWAYLLSTVMTASLITGYSLTVLKTRTRALAIFGILIALYGYLYYVLQLEDYALLFGSLLLFAALGLIMYLTRSVDWYRAYPEK